MSEATRGAMGRPGRAGDEGGGEGGAPLRGVRRRTKLSSGGLRSRQQVSSKRCLPGRLGGPVKSASELRC